MSSFSSQSTIDNKKTTILLIDDNQVNNKLVASILMPQGYDIYVADNGESGVKQAKRIMPDLILLDIMMPEIGGFQVCRHLKDSAVTKDIPIIFITADATTQTQAIAFQAGGNDFITKPIVDVVLIERVKHQIRLYESRKSLITLNKYHDLAEHLSNTGFWASEENSGFKSFTFSKQLESILSLTPNTPQYANFDLDSITSIIDSSSDLTTRNGNKQEWIRCIKAGGKFDKVCHINTGQSTKYIRIWASFKRDMTDCFNAFGAIQDITQVIRTESELSALKTKFEDVATKQNLVEANTQLAHELNQPLAAINLNISYIRQLIESNPVHNKNIDDALDDVNRDVNRATNIVKNIRRILHKEPVIIRPFDLNLLLNETMHVFNRDFMSKNISLLYKNTDEHCMINSNKIGLQQVIVNLLKNSIEAFGTTLTTDPLIKVELSKDSKGTSIYISDNGPGIPEENKENIFEQYFTSKQGNTGMGLAICRTIIQEINGDIQLVDPPANMSTCFKVIIHN